MNIEEFRDYCLSLPGTTEKMPFTEAHRAECAESWSSASLIAGIAS